MRILLICAHTIYFMLTNISGEPNDYILEIKEFVRADVKNDEMIGVDEKDNKPEPEDATHDKVDDFIEDTCDLCAYEPNDYVQEIKEADVKNGDNWSW